MAITFYAFRTAVTTSGTPVQLDTYSVEPDQTVLVKAKSTNAGVISIGNSSAEALNSATENFRLSAGQSIELKVPNTNAIWIDSTSNGDIVECIVGGGGGSSSSGSSSGGGAVQSAGADAESNTKDAQYTSARMQGFNGSTWDRIRTGFSAVVSSVVGYLNSLPFGKYNSSAPTLTDGQFVVLQVDVNGNLKVTQATLGAGEDITNNLLQIGGTNATNVAITAKPVNLGAQAVSSENAGVTTGRQVQLVADLTGKQIVLPYANPENFVSGVTAAMTGTTSTSLIAAPASGLRNYITQLTVSNSHATVGTFVVIQDGNGGTILYEGYAAATGGGFVINFPTPLRQPTTATAIYCADVTTGANVIVSASGYKGI